MSQTDTKIKRKTLSEYLIKIQSDGGIITDGEITFVFSGETYKFKDINEMLLQIEKKCDEVSYPQKQRKLSGWDK